MQDHMTMTQEIYNKHGFLILRNFIPPFFAMYLREYFDTLKKNNKLENGDIQVPLSQCVYGDPAFDTFMLLSSPMVSGAIGIELLPTYTYARIYYNNASLLPHTDRRGCEHSVSLFLGGEFEKIWPMWMKNNDVHNIPQICDLNIGDAVIYQGTKVTHWRDRFEGKSHYQLFMHYVEKDGMFKDKIYDTRPYIGLTSDTKSDYGFTENELSQD
jgi:hypothetical protein